ncbi:mobile element protein [Streptomyces sp. JB150]|uniref:mobile element protein n=1 Tax=Streptomyces sp. JB150 TaxID=2714844 RepID=UPI00140A17FD|nr:mobile element protein [Streptomyces sp. JB150]QIJ61407.1 mobile element protein [Streptomyces sp. JB150]
MAEPLADPAELAASLGAAADDPKLLWALNAASRRFRGAVRHPVSLVTGDAFTLDGNGTESVLLPAAPVLAVTSVTLDGTDLVVGTDYSWSADGFLRRLNGCWPDRLRCISGVYDHGYEPIPEDIQEVVIDQARAMFRIDPGVQTKTVGGQSVTFGVQAAIGVTSQWTAAVERYQLNRGDRP